MQQMADSPMEQVRELAQTVPEAQHVVTKAEKRSSWAAAILVESLKDEIVAVGRKLWEREYVDGNGGNISARAGSSTLLCTPTMISKRDLEPADICLSDLEGNILSGNRLRTSELLLHLEIYKANPRALAIVHCHSPYATAFAMTGTAPSIGLTAEYEASIGPVAVAPYETPGTQAFAETVLPFVQDHNTILLSNHGVVCWADTVTHAEWLVETFENYCKTYLIALQIGRPLNFIPERKIDEILALKRRLGYQDARMSRISEMASPAEAEHEAESEELVRRGLAHLEEQE
jgi:L-fuculose-phosphate aldolase